MNYKSFQKVLPSLFKTWNDTMVDDKGNTPFVRFRYTSGNKFNNSPRYKGLRRAHVIVHVKDKSLSHDKICEFCRSQNSKLAFFTYQKPISIK